LLNLQQQGFRAYMPLYKNFKNILSTGYLGFEAMFPRYVIFQPGNAGQSITTARSTRGVVSLVRFGFEPAVVKGDIVQAIRLFEEERNHAGLAEISPLQPGKSVRFKHAALQGLQGLVKSVSSKRVAVLLELLGQDQLVHVDHSQLELV
jgi:transcriptional antiterminator RfaH